MTDPAIRNNTPPPSTLMQPSPTSPGLLSWIAGLLPTFLALALLTGIGAWGYFADWKLPRFASLFGETEKPDESWCDKHNAPRATCVECNPALLPKPQKHDWCAKHGVHDCPLDHPDVAQLANTPQISAEDLARADRALKFSPRKENDPNCPYHPRRIQLASVEALKRADIKVEPVGTQRIIEAVTAPGEITFDKEKREVTVSSRVAGTLRRVFRGVGEKVKRGDVLALVDSTDVGKAKADFLQAAAQFDLATNELQHMKAAGTGTVAGYLVLKAENAVKAAKISLLGAQEALTSLGLKVQAKDFEGLKLEELARRVRRLGLPEDIVSHLDPDIPPANLIPILSPLDGEVVSRPTVEGSVIDTKTVLLVVADTRRMWLTLNVRQEESTRLALGLPVEFHPDGGGKPEKEAKIAWIDPSVDARTRTVKVRAELDNRDRHLRANTFGSGKIILREETKAVVVPNGALHWDGHCSIVFVLDKVSAEALEKKVPKDREPPMVFHVRCVRVGVTNGDRTEIIAGLLPGERIADENSEVLRGQLLRDNLGGGD